MRMIKMKIIDSDANNKSISNQIEISNKNDTKMQDNARCKIIKVNLEGQIRTIHDSKSDRKSGYKTIKVSLQGKARTIYGSKSDPEKAIKWKDYVNKDDDIELQIPTKRIHVEVRRSGLRPITLIVLQPFPSPHISLPPKTQNTCFSFRIKKLFESVKTNPCSSKRKVILVFVILSCKYHPDKWDFIF